MIITKKSVARRTVLRGIGASVALTDGNPHTHHDLPLVVAGSAAGRLHSGRHLRYPRETPMNNLLLSLLDIAGVPTGQLGDSTGKLEGLSKA